MVTHGGRCPLCKNRTTPGVGARAGFWICMPCKTVFDNYGQIYQSVAERVASAPPMVVGMNFEVPPTGIEAERRYSVVPRARLRRGG
ncbi:hypothetical protein J7643_10640 [bacterium]|nr:hypothetical protein [bacterium]